MLIVLVCISVCVCVCECVCVCVFLLRSGELLLRCGNVISNKRCCSVIDFRCPWEQSEPTTVFMGENDGGVNE